MPKRKPKRENQNSKIETKPLKIKSENSKSENQNSKIEIPISKPKTANSKTIDEIRELRRQLEVDIERTILRFIEETSVVVAEIQLHNHNHSQLQEDGLTFKTTPRVVAIINDIGR